MDIEPVSTRCSRDAAVHIATVIGSTSLFDDLEHREAFEFVDEELSIVAVERPAMRACAFFEHELIEDAPR